MRRMALQPPPWRQRDRWTAQGRRGWALKPSLPVALGPAPTWAGASLREHGRGAAGRHSPGLSDPTPEFCRRSRRCGRWAGRGGWSWKAGPLRASVGCCRVRGSSPTFVRYGRAIWCPPFQGQNTIQFPRKIPLLIRWHESQNKCCFVACNLHCHSKSGISNQCAHQDETTLWPHSDS
jgi:hypothetical protein